MNYDQTERLAKIYRKPKQVTPSFLCLYLVYLQIKILCSSFGLTQADIYTLCELIPWKGSKKPCVADRSQRCRADTSHSSHTGHHDKRWIKDRTLKPDSIAARSKLSHPALCQPSRHPFLIHMCLKDFREGLRSQWSPKRHLQVRKPTCVSCRDLTWSITG